MGKQSDYEKGPVALLGFLCPRTIEVCSQIFVKNAVKLLLC